MKKIIIAATFGLVIGFVVISSILGKGSVSSGSQNAIKKVQMYEIKGGSALSVYLENLVLKGMKADPNTTTGVWSVESNNENNTYSVNYKFRTLGLDQIYIWEVKGDSIKAINGKAISATPELGPQEKQASGTDREKEIYNYSNKLYKEYEGTLGSYEAEARATAETATKFEITKEEVEGIVIKLQDSKL